MRGTGLLLGLLIAAAGATSAAPAREPPLTPNGWGSLRIGMSVTEAARRFRLRVTPVDGDSCVDLQFPGREDISGIARDGRVGSLVVGGRSRLRTDRGIHIGSTEAEVFRAYGRALQVDPNYYEHDPHAHYITWWLRPRERGVMFETGSDGRVWTIRIGDETIGWTDDCG